MSKQNITDPRAELQLLLAATGLNIADGARYLEVQDRTLRRWVNNLAQDIPHDVIEKLRELDRWIDDVADKVANPSWSIVLPDGALSKINTNGMPPASYKIGCVRAWHRRNRSGAVLFA